jgi:acyl-CoA thioester hydrolase
MLNLQQNSISIMFTMTITPRFGEIDGLRHINNNAIPTWFETGRNPVFQLFVPDMDFNKWNLIMARLEVDYVSQMKYGSDITIYTFISHIGRSSFEIYQEAWQNGELGAKGKAVIVHYDFQNQKSVSIPEVIKAKLREHRHEQPAEAN